LALPWLPFLNERIIKVFGTLRYAAEYWSELHRHSKAEAQIEVSPVEELQKLLRQIDVLRSPKYNPGLTVERCVALRS